MTIAGAMLALVTDAFGGRGGIAQYNRDLLGALAGTGAVSSIRVFPRLAPDPVETPSGIIQDPPRRDRVRYAIAALRVALTKRADVIFCGHLYMAPLCALIARLRRAKLIVQMHGIEAWPRPSRLQRAAVEAADLVVCVSRFTRASVLSWAAVAPERLVVLPNTVAPEFKPGDRSVLRAAWGLQGKRVLLTVGRMDSRERYKGHDRVINAIPELVAAGQDVVYLIVGEGDDRRRLENCASEAGVADRVRFVGSVERPRLIDIYRAADLFVMPSTGEGFGIAFLEAMASGTPALGLAVAGAQDALADGELGTSVTESELTAALARALECPKFHPDALARAVRARFGCRSFTSGACAAVTRVLAPS
jgi:phosphatidylinositol alpha-1,6-mannosyltransferase